jgi:hypothetical protein
MNKNISAYMIILLLIIPQLTLAGIENRPGNVDDAYVMDKGTGYLAFGYDYAKESDRTKIYGIPVNAGYGLTDSLEVTLLLPYTKIDPDDGRTEKGMGDLAIRPELVVLKESDSIPQMSLALTIKFDSGSNAIGSSTTDYGLFLNASKIFDKIQLNGNVGYNSLEDSDDSVFLGASIEYSISNSLTLIGEVWSEKPTDSSDDDVAEVLGGAVYDVSDTISLDIGIGTGLHSEDIDLRYTMGATYHF